MPLPPCTNGHSQSNLANGTSTNALTWLEVSVASAIPLVSGSRASPALRCSEAYRQHGEVCQLIQGAATVDASSGHGNRFEREYSPAGAHPPGQGERRITVMRPDIDPGIAGPNVMGEPFEECGFGAAQEAGGIVVPRGHQPGAPERAALDPSRPNGAWE